MSNIETSVQRALSPLGSQWNVAQFVHESPYEGLMDRGLNFFEAIDTHHDAQLPLFDPDKIHARFLEWYFDELSLDTLPLLNTDHRKKKYIAWTGRSWPEDGRLFRKLTEIYMGRDDISPTQLIFLNKARDGQREELDILNRVILNGGRPIEDFFTNISHQRIQDIFSESGLRHTSLRSPLQWSVIGKQHLDYLGITNIKFDDFDAFFGCVMNYLSRKEEHTHTYDPGQDIVEELGVIGVDVHNITKTRTLEEWMQEIRQLNTQNKPKLRLDLDSLDQKIIEHGHKILQDDLAKIGNKMVLSDLYYLLNDRLLAAPLALSSHLEIYLSKTGQQIYNTSNGFWKAWQQKADISISCDPEAYIYRTLQEILGSSALDDDELSLVSINYLMRLAQLLPGYAQYVKGNNRAGNPLNITETEFLAVLLFYEKEFMDLEFGRLWGIDASVDSLKEYFEKNPFEYFVRRSVDFVPASISPFEAGSFHVLSKVKKNPYNRIFAGRTDLYSGPVSLSMTSFAEHERGVDIRKIGRLAKIRDNKWEAASRLVYNASMTPLSVDHIGNLHNSLIDAYALLSTFNLNEDEISNLDEETIDMLINHHHKLVAPTRKKILLTAKEHEMRDHLINRLMKKMQVNDPTKNPTAQAWYCIDDRMALIRTKVKQYSGGSIMTQGTPAHFNVDMSKVHFFPQLESLIAGNIRQSASSLPEFITLLGEIPSIMTSPLGGVVLLKSAYDVFKTVLSGIAPPIFYMYTKFSERIENILEPDNAPVMIDETYIFEQLCSNFYVPDLLKNRFYEDVSLDNLTSLLDDYRLNYLTQEERHNFITLTGFYDNIMPYVYTIEQQAQTVAKTIHEMCIDVGEDIVFVFGHDSANRWNAYEAAHRCGACRGKSSGPNARAFAKMANNPHVRKKVEEKGIGLGETIFVGGVYNTVTNTHSLYDIKNISAEYREKVENLETVLQRAGSDTNIIRQREAGSVVLKLLQYAPLQRIYAKYIAAQKKHSVVGAAIPELGHNGNYALLIGSQDHMIDSGMVFLQSYDYQKDPDGVILRAHLEKSMKVSADINLEYFHSAATGGSGDKFFHNVGYAGTIMIGSGMSGTNDILTGLPYQMTYGHDPVRLQVVIEAPLRLVRKILSESEEAYMMIYGEYVNTVVIDASDNNNIYEYDSICNNFRKIISSS